jgi:hypothetical protein
MNKGDVFIAFHTNGWLVITITEIIDRYWVNTTQGKYSKSQITRNFRKHGK